MNFEIDSAEIWRHDGDAAWHFVTLPEDLAEMIADVAGGAAFGTVPVEATVGATTWTTSVFRDTRRASYLLPVKADVRRREQLAAGDRVTLRVRLIGR